MTFSVLIVEDDKELRDALVDTLELMGYKTCPVADGQNALHAFEQFDIDIVVSDIQMKSMSGLQLLEKVKSDYPDIPIILMTAYGTIQQAVQAMQQGALDYLVKPFEPEVLVTKLSQYLVEGPVSTKGMVACDDRTVTVRELAKKVASSDATVMVTGESGTGKEVLVRYMHEHSERKDKPFVAINCAAIPDNMLEAILFGYQKGAFTGAYKSCPGKFEQAQGGTLLLDEISEMSLGLQAKLLRVLQEREVERLGDQKTIPLDVRVMATSNRDMPEEVRENRFREDLYYRLNVFRIEVPTLRERPDDIIPLAEFLLTKNTKDTQAGVPELTEEAADKLSRYNWPGNVRELDNVMQRAYILHSNGRISADNLIFETLHSSQPDIANDESQINDESLGGDLRARERNMILDALKQTAGSRKNAAEKLGISPRTLRYKLARMREEGIALPA